MILSMSSQNEGNKRTPNSIRSAAFEQVFQQRSRSETLSFQVNFQGNVVESGSTKALEVVPWAKESGRRICFKGIVLNSWRKVNPLMHGCEAVEAWKLIQTSCVTICSDWFLIDPLGIMCTARLTSPKKLLGVNWNAKFKTEDAGYKHDSLAEGMNSLAGSSSGLIPREIKKDKWKNAKKSKGEDLYAKAGVESMFRQYGGWRMWGMIAIGVLSVVPCLLRLTLARGLTMVRSYIWDTLQLLYHGFGLNAMFKRRGYAMNGMFKLNVMVVKNEINKINSSAYLIESSNVCKDEAIDKFVLYKTEVENQLGKKIKVVRSDRGGKYVASFAELCAKHGIRHEFTAPYSPQQNGIAERKNRTLKEMVTAMLISSGMSQDMWGEAILTATYLLNKIPRKEKEETPYELWMGRKPSYQYLRVWGCLAKVAVPTPKAQKIGPKSVDCIFIGYAKNSTAYRFIVHESKNPDIQKNTIMESRNASFFENIFPCLSKETGSSSRLDDKVVQDKRQRDDNDLQNDRQDQTDEEEVEPRRSKRARNEKSFGPDFVSFMVENEPTSYREAVTSSEGQQWREAIKSEIESILQNHTWELVDLPPGCKPLGYKWIFKKKMKADGTVDKYKARLVIQGFRQREGLDYFDTYSPVTRITSIRMIIAIAALRNLEIHQMDVKTAFLNGDLEEEIYINQPEDFIAPGQEGKVCRLVKSLYGLKQAPKKWHQKFDHTMLESGFKINECDKCVYVKDTSAGYVILCLYVDDMLIVGSNDKIIRSTKDDMGLADVILGMKIIRTQNGLVLSQVRYVDKIINTHNAGDFDQARTPIDNSLHLSKNRGLGVAQLEYSRIIGMLMYLMTGTRLDLAYAVSRLSRYTSNLSYGHWKAITRISDIKDSRSTSGYLFTLGGAAISWKSSKQNVIAKSTMESEFIMLDKCREEEEWLRQFVEDIPWWPKLVTAISIHCDSKSALGRAKSTMYNGKSRHIYRRHNSIRQLLSTGVISIDYVASKDNIADPFTKSLSREQVCHVRLYNSFERCTLETDGESVLREALILDGHTKDILCEKGDSLLEPMTLIANARVEREKGVHCLDSCLANLDNAIDSLHKCKVKANDLGSLYFLQAQALCLRALSRYENCNSKKIIRCKQNFTEDIEKVLKLVTNTYFSELAAKYMCLSNYINKLFCLVIDVLMTEHDENDHGLIEKIISLCDPNCDVGMLWQFKSHHSHLKSELIEDYFAENCNFSMEERGHSEEPERMVSNIAIKVTKSLKSRCRAAHFYYDQGERMLLMGKMTKALDHAREGCERRYHLLKENFELTLRDAKVYTFHMNHIVAARAWSISFEEFILAPNNSFICYLNSVHQEATILELIGDKLMAMSALEWGKCLSLQRGPSFYLGRFHVAISKHSFFISSNVDLAKWRSLGDLEFLSIEVLLKMQLNAKPSRKGHKNSKYGCRCWECTCRFSLLSLLKEKGKDYVFKDETSNARDVFLENICLVVSLSSLPSSESPMTLSMLFELVKRTEIIVVHATHIAELIYIISWVACTKGKSDGDFSIPSETLIVTLKHALILSRRHGELWNAPWGTDTIVDTILPNFKWIVKDFEDGSFTGTLDGRISNIICHMEGWFGQHEDILLEEPMDGLYVRLGC
ncbi:retrovirus-related pol polyprotein from transposon TNT 1-94 [Tanacetum coccineum]